MAKKGGWAYCWMTTILSKAAVTEKHELYFTCPMIHQVCMGMLRS